MRRAGKALRRLVGADEVIDGRRDHGRQRVADDDDAQPVRQRCAYDVPWPAGVAKAVPAAARDKKPKATRNAAPRRRTRLLAIPIMDAPFHAQVDGAPYWAGKVT